MGGYFFHNLVLLRFSHIFLPSINILLLTRYLFDKFRIEWLTKSWKGASLTILYIEVSAFLTQIQNPHILQNQP